MGDGDWAYQIEGASTKTPRRFDLGPLAHTTGTISDRAMRHRNVDHFIATQEDIQFLKEMALTYRFFMRGRVFRRRRTRPKGIDLQPGVDRLAANGITFATVPLGFALGASGSLSAVGPPRHSRPCGCAALGAALTIACTLFHDQRCSRLVHLGINLALMHVLKCPNRIDQVRHNVALGPVARCKGPGTGRPGTKVGPAENAVTLHPRDRNGCEHPRRRKATPSSMRLFERHA